MKFMLLINVPSGPYQHTTWPPGDFEAHLAHMRQLNNTLTASGELVTIEALTAPDQAKRVRASEDGAPITDGIFPESKEFLAGFWIVDVDTPERAFEIAAMASRAPGPGGVPLNLPIVVRPIMADPGMAIPS